MSEPALSIANSWRVAAVVWQRFFHAPIDARRLALVRIGFAVVMLVNFSVLYPDLETWYGEQGLYPSEAAESHALPQQWTLLRWISPTNPAAESWLHGLFWLTIASAAMLLVGFLSQLNALVLFVMLVSWQNRNPVILDGEDTVMRLVGFYLLLMRSGRAWSVDSWLARTILRRPTDVCPLAPAWPLRLLQLQMVVIFIAAALYKLGGLSWIDGTALSYVCRLNDTFGRFPVPDFVFETPLLVRLMTWSVIAVELIAPLFLWFKETRRSALLLIVLFHLANEYTMSLFLFHWIMLVGWTSFLTSYDLPFSLLSSRRDKSPQPAGSLAAK
jgi:uncharacterized membrane protein YphA (DoxX/SURF4 family)